MRLHPRTRTALAWLLWVATMASCAGGLVVTLLVTRPLTAGALAEGAAFAVAFPLGYATIGLVLTLRRPANPIGWLGRPTRSAGCSPPPAWPGRSPSRSTRGSTS